MAEGSTEIALHVDAGDDADAEEVSELTAKLRRQLLELDVASVDRPVEGEAPEGTRGIDVLALGTLIIQLAKSSGALKSVVTTVQRWLSGHQQRTVKLEVDGDTLVVTGVSSGDQARLITSWIERHAGQ
jgi:hypothetical protein